MSHHFRREVAMEGYRSSYEEPMLWPPPSMDEHEQSSNHCDSERGSSSRHTTRADNREDLIALGLDVNQDDDLGELLSQLSKYSGDFHHDESDSISSLTNGGRQQQQQQSHCSQTPTKKSAALEPLAVSRTHNASVPSRAASLMDDESPLIEEGELRAILEQLSSKGVDLERSLHDPVGRQRLLQSIMEQKQQQWKKSSESIGGARDGPLANIPPYERPTITTDTPVFQPPPPPAGDRAWYEAMRVFEEQLERTRAVSPSARKRERTSSNSSGESRGKRRRSKHDAKAKKKKKEKEKEDRLERKKLKEAAEEAKKLLQRRKAEEKALTHQISELNGKKELLMKRSDLLKEELGRLQRQYDELCRKMQRVKEGHRASLLQENLRLQAEIEKQLAGITDTVTEMNKVLSNAAARLNKLKKQLEQSEKEKSSNKPSALKEKVNTPAETKSPTDEKLGGPVWYEYFDAGSHWCKVCNVIVASLFDMLAHIHTVAHKAKLDVKEAPWMPERVRDPSRRPLPPVGAQTRVIPIKGVEFLVPTNAFYCALCREFAGDPACAEDHLKSETHRINYERLKSEHPLYERTYNMDKAASMTKRTLMAAANAPKQEALEEGLHLVQRSMMANMKPNNHAFSLTLPRFDKLQMKIAHPNAINKAPLTEQKLPPNTTQLTEKMLMPRHMAEKALLQQKFRTIPLADAAPKRSHSPEPARPPNQFLHNRSRSPSASRNRRRRISRSGSPPPHQQRRLHERSRSRERRLPSSPPRSTFVDKPRTRTIAINSSAPATKTKPPGVKSETDTWAQWKNRQYQDHANKEAKAPISKCNKQKPQSATKGSLVAKKSTPIAPAEFIASFCSKESAGDQKGGKSANSRKLSSTVLNGGADVHSNEPAPSYGPALPTNLVPTCDDTGNANNAVAKGSGDAGGEICNLVSTIVSQVDLKDVVN
uniref:U1-type domain-containing protein n=1 Tax=Plectus sambesii TaxID=2011161 RepID=A0A914X6I4_9BILA